VNPVILIRRTVARGCPVCGSDKQDTMDIGVKFADGTVIEVTCCWLCVRRTVSERDWLEIIPL
jgi:hypothetical protein